MAEMTPDELNAWRQDVARWTTTLHAIPPQCATKQDLAGLYKALGHLPADERAYWHQVNDRHLQRVRRPDPEHQQTVGFDSAAELVDTAVNEIALGGGERTLYLNHPPCAHCEPEWIQRLPDGGKVTIHFPDADGLYAGLPVSGITDRDGRSWYSSVLLKDDAATDQRRS